MNTLSQGGTKWSRDEHVIALNTYWQLSFGSLHHRNPKIIELASILGRTASSVAMKLSNFARLDPALSKRGIKGLAHGAKGEENVWNEFAANPEQLLFESERLLAERLGQPLELRAEVDTSDLPPEGKEREAIVRVRVNQSLFRRRIISAYEGRCCVTGLAVPELLIASHIVPWSKDEKNRMNPRNGLCLNALHDKAFDCGLMWIEDGLVIRFAERLGEKTKKDAEGLEWLRSFDGQKIRHPQNFTPDSELLNRHREASLQRVAI